RAAVRTAWPDRRGRAHHHRRLWPAWPRRRHVHIVGLAEQRRVDRDAATGHRDAPGVLDRRAVVNGLVARAAVALFVTPRRREGTPVARAWDLERDGTALDRGAREPQAPL